MIVGYDLDRSASPNYNPSWYANYLKASYLGDKATGLTYAGSPGSIFERLSGTFGQVYPEDWPDYIEPAGGSSKVLDYNATQAAGIAYSGAFGTSIQHGKSAYLGFAFETISSFPQRSAIVERVLDFFEGSVFVENPYQQPSIFRLEQNYPNPFNPSTVIRYQLSVTSSVSLSVYDVLGQEVATLVNRELPAGFHTAEWNAGGSSGLYYYKLEAVGAGGRRFVETKKMMVLR